MEIHEGVAMFFAPACFVVMTALLYQTAIARRQALRRERKIDKVLAEFPMSVLVPVVNPDGTYGSITFDHHEWTARQAVTDA